MRAREDFQRGEEFEQPLILMYAKNLNLRRRRNFREANGATRALKPRQASVKRSPNACAPLSNAMVDYPIAA